MVAGCRGVDELITFAQQLAENLALRVLAFGLRAESDIRRLESIQNWTNQGT
jgi:hypothetical protein